MSRATQRVFDDAFKLAAIARLDAGEAVCAVAQDLRVLRKDLYKWRAQVRAGGPAGLHKRGRPTKGDGPPLAPPERDELATAHARIAELERKIGQQQVELDFFRGALRRVRTASKLIGASGATPSMVKSGT